ncbi:MAG: hypothetical protein LBK76_10390, partial [Verrucomicrobiales bacterium]|nr:hypothetical protein [Verrucomicrobiales bacterium]
MNWQGIHQKAKIKRFNRRDAAARRFFIDEPPRHKDTKAIFQINLRALVSWWCKWSLELMTVAGGQAPGFVVLV